MIRVFGLAAGLALAAGCGDSSSPPATAGDLCRAMVRAEVSRFDRCSTHGNYDWAFQSFNDCQTAQEAADAGRVVYDAAKAQACLDALGAIPCTAVNREKPPFAFVDFQTACAEALVPQVADGGTCFNALGFECTSGRCSLSGGEACLAGGLCEAAAGENEPCDVLGCRPGLLCVDSTCVPPAVVGAGADCSADETFCADGQYCDAGLCAGRKAASETCAGDEECRTGLYCGTGNVCTAYLRQGGDCAAGRCAADLVCDAGDRCATPPRLGDECAPRDTVRAADLRGGTCAEGWCDTSQLTPTCVPFLAPGDPCSPFADVACGFGYSCWPVGESSGGLCGRSYCGARMPL
jgi:hypothetical protein